MGADPTRPGEAAYAGRPRCYEPWLAVSTTWGPSVMPWQLSWLTVALSIARFTVTVTEWPGATEVSAAGGVGIVAWNQLARHPPTEVLLVVSTFPPPSGERSH